MPLASLLHRIASLGPLRKPRTPEEIEAGVLVRPIKYDPELDAIGDRWKCWALRGESPDDHRWRLQVHLTSLQIALEEDLATILNERR